MINNEDQLKLISDKRVDLIKDIHKPKYSNIEIAEKDQKANEFFHNKIVPYFKFEEDFYFDLEIKKR